MFVYCNVFEHLIYSCDVKAEFSASLLQSSVSHDPLEIILIYWFSAQETSHIMIKLKTAMLLNICCQYSLRKFTLSSKITEFILIRNLL